MSDDALRPGLEDVLVADTRLSGIDGEAGELTIAGFALDELAPNATFEETVSLLREDRLPSAAALAERRSTLAAERSLPDVTHDVLQAAASSGRGPMEALRMGAAQASLESETAEPGAEADRLIAQFPTIVAAYWRYRTGAAPIAPDPELGHAANYLYMLTGEVPGDAAVRGLETYLNAVVDHGLNASTFTARVITSTESDVVSAVTGAVGALKGPLHGGAPGPVLDMLHAIEDRGDPEAYLREQVAAGERLMGFGHRVYSVRDPRAAVLAEAAETFYREAGDWDFFELARDVEAAAVSVLDEEKSGHDLETNVEFYTALLLNGLGIPQPLFTTTFAVARVVGWTAHALEQRNNNRLIRPRSRYVGATGRTWTPVAER